MKILILLFLSGIFTFPNVKTEVNLPSELCVLCPENNQVIIFEPYLFHSDVESLFIEKEEELLRLAPLRSFYKLANSSSCVKRISKAPNQTFKKFFLQRSTFK